MLSIRLYSLIQENLNNKKQTILFLNRRGYSTFVMCRECGYTVKCNKCNVTMTYHGEEKKLKCHYCGYERKSVSICPECKSKNIRYFGTGTEKLQAEISKIFPNATTIRMDVDTVTKKNSHEIILNKFKNENIDILIGTQMVVKGHHFPNVTLVGVIAADSSLYTEDYRSNERTFQLLTQVAGRAGREGKKGKVIIQTYNPDNFAIECSKMQNYKMFYDEEIKFRKLLKYPPFYDIIKIDINDLSQNSVSKISIQIYEKLINENRDNKMAIYRPMPSPIDKIKNRYRWRIMIRCKFTNSIIDIINKSIDNITSKTARISVDVNPNSMM
jgi:primosomal protein N' (replication factor Y)